MKKIGPFQAFLVALVIIMLALGFIFKFNERVAETIALCVLLFIISAMYRKIKELKKESKESKETIINYEKGVDELFLLTLELPKPNILVEKLLSFDRYLGSNWCKNNAKRLFESLKKMEKTTRTTEYLKSLFFYLTINRNNTLLHESIFDDFVETIEDKDYYLIANLLVGFYYEYSKKIVTEKKLLTTSCDTANDLLIYKISEENYKFFLKEANEAVNILKDKSCENNVLDLIKLEIDKTAFWYNR